MSIKTKNKTSTEKIAELSRQTGIMLMAAAVTLGMLELPDHGQTKIIVPNQPAFAFAPTSNNDQGNNQLRRESEETAPHYVSYSETQRTPSRSGRT